MIQNVEATVAPNFTSVPILLHFLWHEGKTGLCLLNFFAYGSIPFRCSFAYESESTNQLFIYVVIHVFNFDLGCVKDLYYTKQLSS